MTAKTKYNCEDRVKIKGSTGLWSIIKVNEDEKEYGLVSYHIPYYTKDLKLIKPTSSRKNIPYPKIVKEDEITRRVHLDKNFVELQEGDIVTYISRTGQYTVSATVCTVVDLSSSKVKIQIFNSHRLVKSNNLVLAKVLPCNQE